MAKIKREGVTSSAIRSIGHDKDAKRLEVAFKKSGAVYAYNGVSTRSANALKNASSVGRHFNRNIRDNYDYDQVSKGRGTRGKKRGR